MKLTGFGFLLALALPIVVAYPVPEASADFEDYDLEERDACAEPTVARPQPVGPGRGGGGTSVRSRPVSQTTSNVVPTNTGTTSITRAATTRIVTRPTIITTTTTTTTTTTSTSSTTKRTLSSSSSSISTSSTSTSAGTVTTAPPSGNALRGVNIGNWLVIEPWMDDGSLLTGKFKGAPDQWTFDGLDTDGSAIKAHWDSWFTQADVQKLKGYGFNALRIPIGFWAINNDNTPYRKGAADYMDKAIQWARSAGMKVLIDCHGSPGSQNGEMHSGHQGVVDWQQGNNLDLSTKILQQMVQRWGTINNADVVFAIEIVNEPTANAPNSFSKSQSWAADTYNAIQTTIKDMGLNKNLQIITHDSFMGITKFIPYASKLTSPVNVPTFGVDQHDYQLYTDADNALVQSDHIKKACGWASALSTTKSAMPVYVGEWSALTNICAQTDGKTTASKLVKSGSCTGTGTKLWSPQLIEQVRRYVEAQLDVYEAHSDGHFIWNFKAPGGWGLYNLIDIGAYPQPINQRRYPNQCSASSPAS